MSGYTYDLPATAEQLKAIGMVATEWQRLESVVDIAIWQLAGVGETTGRAITTNLNFPNRLDMLKTLFHLSTSDEAEYKELSSLCHVMRNELSRKRGEVVHADWVRGDGGSPLAYVVEARGKYSAGKVGLLTQPPT